MMSMKLSTSSRTALRCGAILDEVKDDVSGKQVIF